MKNYIKTDNKGIPETDTEHTTRLGFQTLGFETFFNYSKKEIEDTRSNMVLRSTCG